MNNGWKLVAQLGDGPRGYPHLLVDNHGWAVRWGPDGHADMKYYSGLPAVLEGLVEHGVRRHLLRLEKVLAPQSLAEEVRAALRAAGDLATRALRRRSSSSTRPA